MLGWVAPAQRVAEVEDKLARLTAEVEKLSSKLEALGSVLQGRPQALAASAADHQPNPALEALDLATPRVKWARAVSDSAVSMVVKPQSDTEPGLITSPRLPYADGVKDFTDLKALLGRDEDEVSATWRGLRRGKEGACERVENAAWRLWARAHREGLESARCEPRPPPPRIQKRYVFAGALLGAALVLVVLPRVAPPVPVGLFDDATLGFKKWLNVTLNASYSDVSEPDKTLPGLALAKTLSARYPMLLVPGLVSSGLEVWRARECLGGPNAYFRQRLWGTTTMLRAAMRNTSCWMEHMALDPETGLDPPNVKLRAASGFEAADYIMPGYWVWAKLLENLAAVGYDGNTMTMFAYDWRLSFPGMEKRDQLFTRMQIEAERLVESTGLRLVVLAHSMGTNVWMYFMQWVTTVGRRNTPDPTWVDRHVHAIISLGGAFLGAMGPLTALLSGEAHLGALGVLLEPLTRMLLGEVGRTRIRDMLRTWGALYELLPLGGDAVWGNEAEPTDCRCDLLTRAGAPPMGTAKALELIRNLTGPPPAAPPQSCAPDSGAGSCEGRNGTVPETAKGPVTWDPLENPLPLAPNVTLFCLYGVGVKSERAYRYTPDDLSSPLLHIDYNHHMTTSKSYNHGAFADANMDYGLVTVDGDGTVPLMSLGYMCRDGWSSLRGLNPGRSPIYTREYVDDSVSLFSGDIRGGPRAAKHVEILGNHEVIQDIVHIVAGQDDSVREDRVHSRIDEISRRVTRRLHKARPHLAPEGAHPSSVYAA